MTTKKEVLMIIDINGKPEKTKTVTVYPAGAGSPSVVATNNGDGTYTIELDPSVDPDIISERYDIWWDALKKIPNTGLFGPWIWRVTYNIDTDPITINYSAMTDIDGDTLPATIPDAFVQVTSMEDVGLYLDSMTDTQVVVKGISGGGFPITGAGGVDALLTIHGG